MQSYHDKKPKVFRFIIYLYHSHYSNVKANYNQLKALNLFYLYQVTGQYSSGQPWALCRAATQFGRVPNRWLKNAGVTLFQCCLTLQCRAAMLEGESAQNFCIIVSKTVSMKFMSGLCESHLICCKYCHSSQLSVSLAVS